MRNCAVAAVRLPHVYLTLTFRGGDNERLASPGGRKRALWNAAKSNSPHLKWHGGAGNGGNYRADGVAVHDSSSIGRSEADRIVQRRLAPTVYAAGSSTTSLAAGNFNADGKADLAIAIGNSA